MGAAASLGTPHGPAMQVVIADACRRAHVSPGSIDAVECQADGQPMGDAIEALTMSKCLCGDGAVRPVLTLSSVKAGSGERGGVRPCGGLYIWEVHRGVAPVRREVERGGRPKFRSKMGVRGSNMYTSWHCPCVVLALRWPCIGIALAQHPQRTSTRLVLH